jgi:hypothetical protein
MKKDSLLNPCINSLFIEVHTSKMKVRTMNMQVKPSHYMSIMDHTGDRTMTWDPADPSSVRDARNEFDRLLRDGYTAFRMNVVMDNGVVVEEKGGDLIRTFDPAAGKLMLVPRRVGG